MGGLSLWHWLIVLIVIMLFFGRGKMSDLMGDFAKGIKSFKKGLADDDTPAAPPAPPSQIAASQPVTPVQSVPTDTPRA